MISQIKRDFRENVKQCTQPLAQCYLEVKQTCVKENVFSLHPIVYKERFFYDVVFCFTEMMYTFNNANSLFLFNSRVSILPAVFCYGVFDSPSGPIPYTNQFTCCCPPHQQTCQTCADLSKHNSQRWRIIRNLKGQIDSSMKEGNVYGNQAYIYTCNRGTFDLAH